MVSRVIPVDPFDLVIFGGTGDLAHRKILPGLYRRFWAGQMTRRQPDHRGGASPKWTMTAFRAHGALLAIDGIRIGGQARCRGHRAVSGPHALCCDRCQGRGRLGGVAGHDAARCRAGVLFLGGAVAVRRSGGTAAPAWHRRRAKPDRGGKAVRPRSCHGPGVERHAGAAFR